MNFTDVGSILIPTIYAISFLMVLVFGIKAAIDYMLSQGDPKALEKSRNSLIFAFLGIFLIFCAYFLTRFVADIFGYELLI